MSQSSDPSKLKEKLQGLLNSLRRFNQSIDSEFRMLDTSWNRIDGVWDGRAYDEFEGGWRNVRHSIQEYNRVSRRFERYLEERIEALERFERGG